MADVQKPIIPLQPPLFTLTARGELMRPLAEVPVLSASSSLEVARWWYRQHLEQQRRPLNTVNSYMYDLALLQDFIGPKAINRISGADIEGFLGLNPNKSTRKRRLTSIGGLFRYLIKDEKLLTDDPSDKFYPDFIQLKTPDVLSADEQERLLAAAREENLRTYLIVWLLLKMGLTRGELLGLKVDHIDMSTPEKPIVHVYYEEKRWEAKERELEADAGFGEDFRKFLQEYNPERRLFEIMPQSVNKLVDRVATDARINKRVTPQSLRDTYAVDRAKEGATESKLLHILGLAPDSRNRRSVQRYTKLAAPPVAGVS